MPIKKLNKKTSKSIGIISLITFLSITGYNIYKNKNIINTEDASSTILNTTDFAMGLKKVPQLEYAVGDCVVNVYEDYSYYKTFEKNPKYEIFIDKKSENIDSLHYVSDVNDINEADKKYLKNIYNLSFSNMSSYLFDKTNEILDTMCSSEYISSKAAAILKNNSITEVITLGKTSEINITVLYSKNEAVSVDIAILKGNKW